MSQSTIQINGVLYDTATGMPVSSEPSQPVADSAPTKKIRHSHQIHQHLQKSHTLNRRTVKKEAPVKPVARPQAARSPMVSKFAPHPKKPGSVTPRLMNDIGPSVHPVVKRTEARLAAKSNRATPTVKPAAAIKQEALKTALENAPSHSAAKQPKSKRRTPRALSLTSVALALLLLGGYLTYINLPSLSVRVAAAQAGINASYPAYQPDGYRLADVSYSKGTVSLTFAANAGPQNFTITQQQTAWDSTAVKENYVKPNWGNDVTPYTEHGLTIYAHDGNAVWVNGGILYTISGDAPLSSSQVRGIATTL